MYCAYCPVGVAERKKKDISRTILAQDMYCYTNPLIHSGFRAIVCVFGVWRRQERYCSESLHFFPSWLCTMGKAGGTPKGFSHCTTKTCIDILIHFKVTWDLFASLNIIQLSKCSLREGCPGCPGWASHPTAPQISLQILALPSSTSSSLILTSFPFVFFWDCCLL